MPDIDDYKRYLIKSRNMRKLPVKLLIELQRIYEDECVKSAKMHDRIEELDYKYKHLEEDYIRIVEENKYLDKRLNETLDFKIRKFIKKILRRK